jgi:RNA polymerase sigma factor (sigma-70 family)
VEPNEARYRTREKWGLNGPVLTRIAAGEQAALEDCLKQYGGLVWSLAKRLCGDPGEVEDAVQEVFIELWRGASKYDPKIASESTFISMLARRKLIDRYRKRRSNPAQKAEGLSEVVLLTPPRVDEVETKDEAAKAAICFQSLTENAQKVLQLAILQDNSHTEIASLLGLPLGSVKSLTRRGLLQLRDCMQRRLPLPEGATL